MMAVGVLNGNRNTLVLVSTIYVCMYVCMYVSVCVSIYLWFVSLMVLLLLSLLLLLLLLLLMFFSDTRCVRVVALKVPSSGVCCTF